MGYSEFDPGGKSRRPWNADRKLGAKRADVHLQGPLSRIRRNGDQKSGSHRRNSISPDTGCCVCHRRCRRSITPAIAIVIVGELIDVRIAVGCIKPHKIADLRRNRRLPIHRGFRVKPPMNPIEWSLPGQIHHIPLGNLAESSRQRRAASCSRNLQRQYNQRGQEAAANPRRARAQSVAQSTHKLEELWMRGASKIWSSATTDDNCKKVSSTQIQCYCVSTR